MATSRILEAEEKPERLDLSTSNDAALSGILKALQSLVDDIDCFLVRWMQKLDHDVLSYHCSESPDELLRKRFQELVEEKQRWEARQSRETQLVHARCEQITAAWLQLEAEQRQFLQLKRSHYDQSLEASSVSEAIACDSAGPRLTTAAVKLPRGETSDPLSKNLMYHVDDSLASDLPAHEAAIRQFQRLIQEAGSSTSNSSRT